MRKLPSVTDREGARHEWAQSQDLLCSKPCMATEVLAWKTMGVRPCKLEKRQVWWLGLRLAATRKACI